MTRATEIERYMLSLINDARIAANLAPLMLELNLNAAADAHSQWMLDTNNFDHTGINGTLALGRMRTAEFDLGTRWLWAENILARPSRFEEDPFDTVDRLFADLLASPSHRENMLDPALELIGLGIAEGLLPGDRQFPMQGMIVTQNFAFSNGLHDLDIVGTPQADVLRGGTGDDLVDGSAGNDLIFGDAGNDEVTSGVGNDSVNAGAGNDGVQGGAGQDFLRGAAGEDTLVGDAGNDFLIGDDGNDDLSGGLGQDSLSGGNGDDSLAGHSGFDVLQGGNGNDTLSGGTNADNLFASAGNDLLRGDEGFDRLFGGLGDDTLEGGTGPDALFGNDGADEMFGQQGDDRNYGGGGNDFIEDGQGNDLLEAGAGFDTLNGGEGDDMLFGRFNADTFVFTGNSNGFGHDTIGDFAATNPFERIDLGSAVSFLELDDLLANQTTQVGSDVLISVDENSSILLLGVSHDDLSRDDFIF